MSALAFKNADAKVQSRGTVVRIGARVDECLLASSDLPANCAYVLGVRTRDVAPGESDQVAYLFSCLEVLLASPAEQGQTVWLSDDGTGRGTVEETASPFVLGFCRECRTVSDRPYAVLLRPSLWGTVVQLANVAAELRELAAVAPQLQSLASILPQLQSLADASQLLLELARRSDVILMRADDGS